MENRQGKYRIVKTQCFPNSWKVVPFLGRNSNATHLYHPTKEKAEEQVTKIFNGIVIETLYMEN